MPHLFLNDVAPRSIYFDLVPSDVIPDLRTVTSVSAIVQRTDGVRMLWDLSVVSQSQGSMTVRRTLLPGDLPVPGVYTGYASITSAGATHLTEPFSLPNVQSRL